MSVLDKVHRRLMDTSQDGDPRSQEKSSTPTGDDFPVIHRLRIVVTQLTDYAKRDGTNAYARHAWVAIALFDNLLDEMPEGFTNERAAEMFVVFGKIIEWCGTGDVTVLPPQIRKFLAENFPHELPAIEAPKETVPV